MCGLLFDFSVHKNLSSFSPALESFHHRGPDETGKEVFTNTFGTATLGHKRLSIIDLAEGQQPLKSTTNKSVIIFNGEIFNFKELKEDLKKTGYIFHTHSDTEVILALYEAEGEASFSKLNGMFAFVIYDLVSSKILFARDRYGVKPLYFSRLDGGLSVSSTLESILLLHENRFKIDFESIASFLHFDYIQSPRSIVDGILKLMPGQYGVLDLKDRSFELKIFFDHKYEVSSDMDLEFAEQRFEELFRKSIKRQLLADVDVGVFLSGGIDSSLITAIASQEYGKKLKSFCITFEDDDYDEGYFAEKIAKHFKTEHYSECLRSSMVAGLFEEALENMDEPIADPSLLPTFMLSKIASKKLKVCLGGDGGDELFGGYPTYKAIKPAQLYNKLPDLAHNLVESLCQSLPDVDSYQSITWKLKKFFLNWERSAGERHLNWMSNYKLHEISSLLQPRLEDYKRFDAIDSTIDINSISPMQIDFHTYLPGSVLAKVDKASMANSLEVRPPFLDNEVVEFAFSMPEGLKIHNGTTKYFLKKFSEKYLDPQIVHRKKKGFGIPLARWLRGPLKKIAQDSLLDSSLVNDGVLNNFPILQMYNDHMRFGKDFSKQIWSLIVLEKWYRKNRRLLKK